MKTPVGGGGVWCVGCVGVDQCDTDCVPQGVEKCARFPNDDNVHALRIQEEGNRKEVICAADNNDKRDNTWRHMQI
jgi:hypothetical protein